MPDAKTMQELTDEAVRDVRGRVAQKGHPYPPGHRGFAVPAAVSQAVVQAAVKMAVDLAVNQFGPHLDAMLQTQRAVVDGFISDAALEAISAAVRHLEGAPPGSGA